MGSSVLLWVVIVPFRFLCFSMCTSISLMVFMCCNADLWELVSFHVSSYRFQWVLKGSYGFLWVLIVSYSFLRDLVGFY